MKVILLKDDKRYGKKGDVINVNDGFANNYLIPNKIAVVASSSNLNEARQLKESEMHKAQVILNEANALKEKLKLVKLLLKVKIGDNGKLFGSVTSKEISEELEKQGISIDKRKIELDSPIKNTGLFDIKIKLHPQVMASVLLEVVAEK